MPAPRKNAAADARPNGWRPISYVLINRQRIFRILELQNCRIALPDCAASPVLQSSNPILQSCNPSILQSFDPAILRSCNSLYSLTVMAVPAHRMPPLAPVALDTAFFGHPRGLSTLFFTEMWERFSYYGMRALLILCMPAPVAAGGLGFDTGVAGAVYGLYTSMVYMTSLPGGWIADRLIGQRRAVLYGGILIACGHFSMAFPSIATFYLGLALIVVGTGLLKGNVSVIVGQLYGAKDNRRDAGFSIFYMGINLGAFIAPLVCGYLGQRVNWHIGFATAGIGLVFGLIQYVLGCNYL